MARSRTGLATGAKPQPPVQPPFQGLFLDRPAHLIPPTGFSACDNVRIYKNQITARLNGYQVVIPSSQFHFSGPGKNAITGGGLFTISSNAYQYLIIVNQTDIFAYAQASPPIGYLDPTASNSGLVFITPIYNTGTVAASGTAVTGTGTFWNTASGSGWRKNARAGDFISFGANVNDPSATWFKVASVADDTHLTLSTSAGVIGGGSFYTLRQCLNNNRTDARPAFEVFPNNGDTAPATAQNDICMIANFGGTSRFSSADPMAWWAPAANQFCLYFTAASFSAGVLKRYNNLMLYGRLFLTGTVGAATNINQTQLASSDNGKALSLSSGVAFQGTISDGPEPLLHIGVLGNNCLIYFGSNATGSVNFGGSDPNSSAPSSGSVISAQFVGLPVVWQFQTVVRDRGPIGQGLVAEFADRHQFLGIDGEYRYNGLFLQVMNDHLWRGVLPLIDFQNVSNGFVIKTPMYGDISWSIPQVVGSANVIYNEHYMEQANNYLFKPFTQRDGNPYVASSIAYQISCFLGSNPSVNVFLLANQVFGSIVGDDFGNVALLYNNDLISDPVGGNSAAVASSATFADRIVAGERARGLVKRVYPFASTAGLDSGTYNLVVTLKMKDRIDGNVVITDAQNFPITTIATDTGDSNRFTTHYRRGRVAQITFSTPGNATFGQAWTLDGYDIDIPRGSPGGQR